MHNDFLIKTSEPVLITGSNGFIGSRLVRTLLEYGYSNLHCLVRPSSNLAALDRIVEEYGQAAVTVIKGNLLSREDCRQICRDMAVVYHLAAGRGEKSYPDAYMNSVVTTRNLLDAVVEAGTVTRFVNVSSFSVYAAATLKRGGLLDESCALESQPHKTGEAYCFAKVRQDEMVMEYGRQHNLPYTIARPGVVYGPGNKGLTGRVGIGTFGIFLHLGGGNTLPLTYVDNCAEAIVLAGLKAGVDGQVFNIVDDDLPSSRTFLRLYKKRVRRFRSLYVPHPASYFLSWLWEKYSVWSGGQLPLTFNRRRWANYWQGNVYSNQKARELLGWAPRVGFAEAAEKYFTYQKEAGR